MGVVYRAEDQKLEREVALKFLPVHRLNDPDVKGRFEREAKASATLNHPNICTVYEIDEADGKPFIAMELVRGTDLSDKIEEGPLKIEEALDIAVQAAKGLAAAHEAGVVHRDVKSANIMVVPGHERQVKLMDFGLAQLANARTQLTKEGTTVGTMAYMSPEQAAGESVDHRTDIWSYGVVLYQMATGQMPFQGHYDQAIIYSILNEAPQPIINLRPDTPAGLVKIVEKCLNKSADERYQTTDDLAAELHGLKLQFQANQAVPAERTQVAPTRPKRSFVGREAERLDLSRRLRQAGEGSGSLVLIGGEPGVGKTRLCEETLAEAAAQGMLVLVGHSYEGEGAQPFVTFVESLELAAQNLPRPNYRAALGDAVAELAKLVPDLRRMFPDTPDAIQVPPEQQRRYLFNCFQEFISRLSRQHPIVWLLDDLHWADESSLALLQHVAPNLQGLPILVLGTYRDVELDVAKPFEKALAQLVRQRLAHRVTLRRLPEASVSELLGSLAGAAPPASVVRLIYHETEGNPFFVEEVFDHLSEEGRLLDANGQWKLDLNAEELEVPEGVRLVIGRRIERLNPKSPKILAAAAVIGRIFELEILEALEGFDPDDVLDVVEDAENAKLLVPNAARREARYQFTHELIRHTLLESLSLPRRQRTHLRVARAFEKKRSGNIGAIAHHLFQAGAAADQDETIRYLKLAGQNSLASAAAEESRAYFDDALSLEAADRSTEVELLLGRGRAYQALGDAESAVRDLEAALPAFEEAGAVDTVADICYQLASLLWFSLGRIEASRDAADRGLAAVGSIPGAARCRLLAVKGSPVSLSGRYAEAESLFGEAASIAETLGDQKLEGEVCRGRGFHYWAYFRLELQLKASTRAIELLRPTDELWGLADAMIWSQNASMFLGRIPDALAITDELEPLARRAGHFGAQWVAQFARMCDALFRGDLSELELLGPRTLKWCLEAGVYWGVYQTYGLLALLELWRWRYDQAVEYAQLAVKTQGEEAIPISARPTLALVLAYAGDREALTEIDRIDLPTLGAVNDLGRITALLMVTEALALLSEDERVAALYPLMAEPIGCMKLGCFGALMPQTAAGISAAAGRNWDAATSHFEEARTIADAAPHMLERPQICYWYAKMLLNRGATGDREKASNLLNEAKSEFAAIGMPRHLDLVEKLQATI